MLKLFHGSNVVIDKIDLCRSRKGKDFVWLLSES